jgi:hypothetical protein
VPYLNTTSTNPFDDFDMVDRPIRPLWTIDDMGDEEKLLNWCKETIEFCMTFYRTYFQVQLDNLLIFKGVQWLNQDRYSNRFLDRQGVVTRRSPRIVLNYIADAVEHWKSKLTRYRPAVGIYPATPKQEDADKARIAADVNDYIWYLNHIDLLNAQMVELAKVCGEAYRFIRFDPHKGPIHPDQVQLSQYDKRVPIIDSAGNQVMSQLGTPLFIEQAVHIGEIDHEVYPGYHVFEEPCRRRRDINWDILWDCHHMDAIKALYPDKAEKIIADEGFEVFTNYRLDLGKMKDQVVVYELHHRGNEFLDKGFYIKFTKNAILEVSPELRTPNHQLPYIYLSDVDVADQIRGMSFIQQVFPIQHQINACSSLIYKALVLFAHPKYLLPEGAAEIQQLINESTVVQFSGGVPPSLMNSIPVPPDLFKWIEKLEQIFDRLSGIYTMSHGEAPSGVRAAKALRALEEQEDKRSYYMATKFNNTCLIEDAKLSLGTASLFYDDSDGRLAKILGKDNEFKIVEFKVADLMGPFDIRIESTTALSQSPSARIDDIVELSQLQLGPDSLFTKGQIIDFLDLAASDQFKDTATRAYRCAQSENQDINRGADVAPPTEDEDLIVHWKTHIQHLQSREYKEIVTDQVKALFKKHIYITEYLMYEKGYGITSPLGQVLSVPNMGFQMLLATLPVWPVYFKLPVPGQMAAPLQGGMPNSAGMPSMGVPPNGLQASPISAGSPLGVPPMASPPSTNPRA